MVIVKFETRFVHNIMVGLLAVFMLAELAMVNVKQTLMLRHYSLMHKVN